jgi:hypothetical protein
LLSLVILSSLVLLSCTRSSDVEVKGRYYYFLDNIETVEGEDAEFLLWMALPMDHRGQTVEIGEIHPEPVEIIHEPLAGNQIAFWRITDFEGMDRAVLYADFDVVGERVEPNVNPDSIEPYDTESEEYKRYTQSEPWIELTDEIRAKAAELAGEETNPYHRAKKCFDWVIANMTYEYPDVESRGAAKSFKRLTGDCGEFSAVFQALCRSVGIPARSVTSVWLEMSDYHGWAEILLPPYGWVPVDPTFASSFRRRMESGDPADEASLERSMEKRGIPVKDPDWFFGSLYPARVIVFIGANADVRSEGTGIERTFRFMQPGGMMALPPAVEFRGLSPRTVHGGFIVFGDERYDIEAAWARVEKELAASYKVAGLNEEAERGFLLKTVENPKDALSWLNLGDLYIDSDRYDDALDAYQKCLEGEATDVKPILDLIARVHRGNCYDLKGERESALAEYKEAEDSGIDFAGMQDSVQACLKEPYRKHD